MIVVAIIGILAAIAIPNFLLYQAKAKQSEAKANLGAIFTSQVAFRAEKDRYAQTISGFLDWAPAGSTRYAYTSGGGTTTQFSANATANIDTDPTIDTWSVDESKEVTSVINDVTS
jgi:type IV pilus assembly protein PilA